MDEKEELKELRETDKLVLGTERTKKLLERGELERVFLASNCPEERKNTLKRLGDMSSTEILETESDNEELGVLCRKPFKISVIGEKK